MSTQAEFVRFNLSKLGYSSKEDLIENLYLKSIIDSYQRINKTISIENDIRDRFVHDLYHHESDIKKWLQLQVIHINWERWMFKNEDDLGRADLSFELSGMDFIIECKRLKHADKRYFEEGLRRFLDGDYAERDEFAGMLGFVVAGDKTKISQSLREKSLKYDTIDSDFASDSYHAWDVGFKGSHRRKDATSINVYHLFFDFQVSKD